MVTFAPVETFNVGFSGCESTFSVGWTQCRSLISLIYGKVLELLLSIIFVEARVSLIDCILERAHGLILIY